MDTKAICSGFCERPVTVEKTSAIDALRTIKTDDTPRTLWLPSAYWHDNPDGTNHYRYVGAWIIDAERLASGRIQLTTERGRRTFGPLDTVLLGK